MTNAQQPAADSPTAARRSAAMVATACGASSARSVLRHAPSPYASACAREKRPWSSAETRSPKR